MSTTLRVTTKLESTSLPPGSRDGDGDDDGGMIARLDYVSVTIICGVIAFCFILCMIIGCRRKKRRPPPRCQDVVAPTIEPSRSETDGATNIQRDPGSAPNRSRGEDSPPPTYSVIERQTSFTSSVSQTSSMIEVPPMYDDAWDSSDADLDTSGQPVNRSVSSRGPRWSQRHGDRSASGRRTNAADRSGSLQHSRPPRARSHRYHSDVGSDPSRQTRRHAGSRPSRVAEDSNVDDDDDMSEVIESEAERSIDVIAEVTPRSSMTESFADQSERADTQSTQPLLRDAGQLRGATAV